MQTNIIYHNDNLAQLRLMPSNSVDSIVTDSPYGLGKPPDPLKVLPAWLEHGYYEVVGKGFMGKKWDAFVPQPILWKECLRVLKPGGYLLSFFGTRTYDWGTMAIRLAGFEIRDCIQWIYGSGFPKSKASLKPANEPICVARKPGPLLGLNIDECRIPASWDTDPGNRPNGKLTSADKALWGFANKTFMWKQNSEGRWPSNVILDEFSSGLINSQSGTLSPSRGRKSFGEADSTKNCYGNYKKRTDEWHGVADTGGASRFFYVAKASPSERAGSKHPTIKPIKLMTQLVPLVTPVSGICLDLHCGGGPTIEACIITGRQYIGIDNDINSVNDTNKRIAKYQEQPKELFG